MARILVVDDEANIRSSLKSALERRDHQVVTAESFAEGERFARARFDLIFLDVMLPDGNGVDLLKKILAEKPDQMIVMISGHADIDTAVDAIKAGAHDFIEKPLSLDRVMITIDNTTRTRQLRNENVRLSSRVYPDFIGDHPSIRKLKDAISQAAPKANRFLITGENGTGKELVAHAIHRGSLRADGPFVSVNCAALPSELVESELFGHVAGAFTGATRDRSGRFVEADGGTIFLDEIGDMPPAAQAKILRVIENGEVSPVGSDRTTTVNCLIVAATNRPLNELVERGTFRQDLLYRLNVVALSLPPLRERKSDLPVLASFFLRRFAAESGSPVVSLSSDAVKYLMEYSFPGNIRELRNLMERVSIFCSREVADLDDVKPHLSSVATVKPTHLKDAVTRFEQDYIRAAIGRNDGNVTKAARELGIERSLLYKKLKK